NNIGNAISFSQTQDGFLKKVTKALDRMSELSTLAQDPTKDTTKDLALYQKEFATLQAYITDVTGREFNGVALFSATAVDVAIDENDATKVFSMGAIDLATST